MVTTEEQWNLTFAAAFIVRPGLHEKEKALQDLVHGGFLDPGELPRDVFIPLFGKDASAYPVGILFKPEGPPAGKTQRNPVRELIRFLAFGDKRAKEKASFELATRLSAATRQKSGPGLLVLLVGASNHSARVLIWKFPEEDTLQAKSSARSMLLRKVKDAFSTQSFFVKAALFEGDRSSTSFLEGRVEDKQSKSRVREVADFWTEGFLDARPSVINAYGTRMLSKWLKKCIDEADSVEEKSALISAAVVLKGQHGRRLSFSGFARDYLSDSARDLFLGTVGAPDLLNIEFGVDVQELDRSLRVQSLLLDNQFLVSGPIAEFDRVVKVTDPDQAGVVTVSLSGRIASKRITSGR